MKNPHLFEWGSGKDTLQVLLSDMHSGSNYALFPDRIWTGKNGGNHAPNSTQILIREQFVRFAEDVRAARKGKRVILIKNGDEIEGIHHNASDIWSTNANEQAEINVELTHEFQKRIDWQRGDLLYSIIGTETHTLDIEHDIAKQCGAQQGDDDYYSHSHLELSVNGVRSWFVHHGPTAGDGANEGNRVSNWLKAIYYDALKDHKSPPDIVYSGHVHKATCGVFSANEEMRFRIMYGVIVPSWQAKTRYANKAAPVSVNRVGGVYQEIKADGTICVPQFKVIETRSMETVKA